MPILQMILLSITEVPKNEASVFFSGFTLLTESAPGPSFPQAEPFLRLFLDLRYGPVGRTVSSWAHHEPRWAGVHLTPALAAAFAQWGYIFNFLVSHSLRLQTGTVSFVIYFTWWPGGSLTMTEGRDFMTLGNISSELVWEGGTGWYSGECAGVRPGTLWLVPSLPGGLWFCYLKNDKIFVSKWIAFFSFNWGIIGKYKWDEYNNYAYYTVI